MNPFERVKSQKGSIFVADSVFQSAEYRKFLAKTKAKAGLVDSQDTGDAWQKHRVDSLQAEAPRVVRRMRGHAENPLALPGSRPHTSKFNSGI